MQFKIPVLVCLVYQLEVNTEMTFELHMHPVPHFTNNTDFTIWRLTALYNFNIL